MIWLIASLALLPIANGRWSFALAAWIAPACLVAFMRASRPLRAFLGGWLATSVACFFWWNGIFPLKGVAYAVASVLFGLIALVPYLLDRAIAPRLTPLAGTFVFPCAYVSLETLTMIFSPFGSWGAFAYTQFTVKPLVQLASVTGIAGISFLVLWLAPVLVARSRRALLVYAIVFVAVFGFGFARLRSRDANDLVRVATITPRIPTYTVRGDAANAPIHAALQSVRTRKPLPAEGWMAFRTRALAIEQELLNASEAEARNGAALIVWSEGAGIVERADEPAMLARAADLARRAKAHIVVSYLVLDAKGSATFENKNVLADDRGRIVWTYHKAHPVPGMEACIPGDGRLPVAPTPHGRIATAICFDLDFPRLIRQARAADVLLVPADDWREIAPRHSYMAAFRGVEQGLTIVRATSNGLSIASDRFGRVVTTADSFANARIMRASIPHRGAPTLYASIGDVLPMFAAIALIALAAIAWRAQRGSNGHRPSE